MKPMTEKQRADYVVQITAGLVAYSGNPTEVGEKLTAVVKLVDRIDAALQKRQVKQPNVKPPKGK